MRTIRIHVDHPLTVGETLPLPPQAAEHVARVLRLVAGDAVVLFNGDGFDYPSRLLAADRRRVCARVEERRPAQAAESPLALTLAQGIARGEKMDLIVQKATELGVTRIVPLLTERCEVRLDEQRASRRLVHWREVAAAACEQCGRATLPVIEPAQALSAWLAGLRADDACRLALLPEGGQSVRELASPRAAILVVGPEGGFGARDTVTLQQAGFGALRLGPRILRTETAGLAALAALQALYGDF